MTWFAAQSAAVAYGFDTAIRHNIATLDIRDSTGAESRLELVGWTRGFSTLEQMEQAAVSLKPAIIAWLLVGLAVHSIDVKVPKPSLFQPGQADLPCALA